MASQDNRRLRIGTPLGKDALLLTDLSGHEGLSTLFSFEAQLASPEGPTVDFDGIVGKNVTVSILMSDGHERYVNGIVSRFSQSGTVGAHATYTAQIVPWLWFLTRTADCRIFQQLSVPDIVKKIFGEYGFTDFKFKLRGTYDPRDYCVQYRETDYNFVARLLESEGIYYFFEHEDGKHTLVLGDDRSTHEPCPHLSKARFMHENISGDDQDVVTWFKKEQEVRPAKHTATDYNFETPAVDLASTATGKDQRTYEVYDYPAGAANRDGVERLVHIRQEEEDATRVVFDGGGYCRSFTAGYRFDLQGVGTGTVSTFDGAYVLTSVRHRASESYDPEGAGDGLSYENDFECIPASVPFRPARRTPHPVVNGVQTAAVVGPGGEEIFVDKYGRVKVQFHWDREGKRNENSSCWVRISQDWAGKNWGIVSIPRIGQEVVVAFLEGDPDRPIITGRVYNAEQMPPYDLPANATQSGIRSRSSKGGSAANCNEIRFEDKKGEEHVLLHAEKDHKIEVENDEAHEVGHDRTKEVKHDETVTIGHDRGESVGNDENINIARHRTETVGKNETISIGADRATDVGKNETLSIADNCTRSVGKNDSLTVSGSRDASVTKDDTLKVSGNQTSEVEKDRNDTVGKAYVLEAGDQIVLRTGSASIILKSNGDIAIEGNNVTVNGSGKIGITASSDMTLKASKIAEN